MEAPKIEKWKDLVSQLKEFSAWGVHFTPAQNVGAISSWIGDGSLLDGHFYGADKSYDSYLSDADYYSSLFISISCGKYFSESFAHRGGKINITSDINFFFAISMTPGFSHNSNKIPPTITKYGPSFDVGRGLHPDVFKFSKIVLRLDELLGLERNLEINNGRKYTSVSMGEYQLFDDTLETEIDLEILRRIQTSLDSILSEKLKSE